MTKWPHGKREKLDELLGLFGMDVIDRTTSGSTCAPPD
jgi:hypothetical protein